MRVKYNVLIIGAGRIGAFFDTPKSKDIISHAHAFNIHKGFNLLGLVDTNKQKAKKAASIWGSKAFDSLKKAFNQEKIDVAVIAVPDEHHYQILKKISQFPVKLVLVEKPLVSSQQQADKIYNLYKKKKIPVVVNYSRRFLPGFNKIKKDIEKGSYGNFLTGTGYYGKGLLHNGSHLIDFLRWFISEIKGFSVLSSFVDFNQKDPSISAVLNFKKGKNFFLQSVSCRLFTVFEIDLMFEKGRIIIKDEGAKAEIYKIRKNKIFKEYQNLVKIKDIKISDGKTRFYVAANIYDYLSYGKKLISDLESGYKTANICYKIIQKVKKGR